MKSSLRLVFAMLAALAVGGTLYAQNAAQYFVVYALRTDGNSKQVTNGSRVVFNATGANATSIADFLVGNSGAAPGTIRSVTVSGSAFQVAGLQAVLPATINPGQAATFSVAFTPRQLGPHTGTLTIELDTVTIVATLEGSTINPEFTLLYLDPATNNLVPVGEGGTIPFPETTVNASTTLTLALRNSSSGTGFLNAIATTGGNFQVTDLTALPLAIDPGRELRFGVRFTPRDREPQTSSLRIELSNASLRWGLTGTGVAPQLVYTVANENEEPVQTTPGSELVFTGRVGQTVSKTLVVTNTGNRDAVVSAISATAGFQVVNVPFLPVTIPIGESESFVVNFTPTQPGVVRGRLRVGDQTFELTGNAAAARLEFSYSNEAGTTTVAENGTVVLSPARVGESSRAVLVVQNTGTVALPISSIDVTPANGVFTVNAPALPVSLAPTERLTLDIQFSPNNVGAVNGSLRVNNSVLNLSGSGRQPVALPEYRLTGPTGNQNPLQQPTVGLALTQSYALPVRGSLRLSFLSDVFAENPAVQFSTGGRTVNFTIPARSTQAVFENGLTEVRLQTGTVAGTVQLTPTFATAAGLDLTPSDQSSLAFTVARSAPRLLSVDIQSRSATMLTLLVSGYSTTRSLRNLQLQITPRSGVEFTSTSATFSIEAPSVAWFQATQSQNFGGLFTLSVPLVFSRGTTTEDLIRHVESLTLSVSNEVGGSNSISITP